MSASHTPTLSALGDSVKESASVLERLISEQQLPQPSLSPTGRKNWSDAQTYPDILAARSNLIDTAQTLLNLALGPTDTLAAYAGPRVSELDVLRTFVALEVPQAVPLDGSISVSDLAAKIEVKDEAAFYKQLRFAYLMGMFRQSEDGKVAHTALSAAIPESEAWISVRLSKLFCQGAFEVDTALRKDASLGKTTCPCALADPKGLSRTCYDQLEDEPDGRGMEKFSKGMIDLFMHHAGGSYLPFIHGFDWSSLGPDATVVDVGGGNGHIEVQIAPLVPDVKFVVQDQPSNEEAANQLLAEHGLGSRVQFQPHDFFQEQPQLPGGRIPKAYMLLRVLQDWSDADCVRILKPLLPSMENYGTKLWIMNRILPDELGTMPVHKEELLRTLDLLVFTLSGGGERNASDLQRVLGLVDERLKVTRAPRPLNSVFSFIEVMLE